MFLVYVIEDLQKFPVVHMRYGTVKSAVHRYNQYTDTRTFNAEPVQKKIVVPVHTFVPVQI